MNWSDDFKPYNPELRGDLEDYLRDQEEGGADNLFEGVKYYYVLKDNDFLIPDLSFIRVNLSPAPDLSYFVNSDYLMESLGTGHYNMSLVGAEIGIYQPDDVLKNQTWSISGLKLF